MEACQVVAFQVDIANTCALIILAVGDWVMVLRAERRSNATGPWRWD